MAEEMIPCPKAQPIHWPSCFVAAIIAIVTFGLLVAWIFDYGDRRERAGRESERAAIAHGEEMRKQGAAEAKVANPPGEPRLLSGTRTWCESLEKTAQIAPMLASFLYASGVRKVGPRTGESFQLRSTEDLDLWILGNRVNQELEKLETGKAGESTTKLEKPPIENKEAIYPFLRTRVMTSLEDLEVAAAKVAPEMAYVLDRMGVRKIGPEQYANYPEDANLEARLLAPAVARELDKLASERGTTTEEGRIKWEINEEIRIKKLAAEAKEVLAVALTRVPVDVEALTRGAAYVYGVLDSLLAAPVFTPRGSSQVMVPVNPH